MAYARNRLSLALLTPAVALLACSGPANTPPDAGRDAGADAGGRIPDAGPDAGVDAGYDAGWDAGLDAGPTIAYCAAQGGPCGVGMECCGNLACVSAVCQEAVPPSCAGYGAPCGDGVPCCGTAPPPGGWPAGTVPPVPGCLPQDGGRSVCFIGSRVGDPCGTGLWGCAYGLDCVDGGCVRPSTSESCPSSRDGGSCLPGDDCTSYANQIYGTGVLSADPCQSYGLDCEQTFGGSYPFPARTFLCTEPEVLSPPNFPAASEVFSQYSVCGALSNCTPVPGDTAQVGCGDFYIPALGSLAPVCVELCQRPDDCGSLAWDCLGASPGSAGQCLPNYCYAENDSSGNDIASAITSVQGTPVSAQISVLFKPCANGGADTVCLPQNDNGWNTTTGICYRVGAADAGGVGASCDPTGARADLGGLCASGTLCFKGTCLPWCDTGNPTVSPCRAGQRCVAIGGALVSSTANDNGTGVCTETCNPYLDAGWNGCPQTSGAPPSVCKPAGTDNDIYPSPGVCVGGSSSSAALGQPCDPFGWVDPCASGSLCAPNKGGTGFACAQICDPQPSPGLSEPSCAAESTCRPLGPPWCVDYNNGAPADGGAPYSCFHLGVCL
ncbi:MAG: hypothetical protein ACYDCL_02770 [Myxococcales bacterium]